MINRIAGYFAQPPPELYVVSVVRDEFIVTAHEAARIVDEVNGWDSPWVRFTDVFGARTYVRNEFITVVRECDPEERDAVLKILAQAQREDADSGDGKEE